MKKSFTLIEIIIAVIIAYISVMAVMDVIASKKHLINLSEGNKIFSLYASVAFLSSKIKGSDYDRLIDFNITNDEIIRDLKKERIYIKKEQNLVQEYNLSNSAFREIIYKIKAYDKFHSITLYSIGIQ